MNGLKIALKRDSKTTWSTCFRFDDTYHTFHGGTPEEAVEQVKEWLGTRGITTTHATFYREVPAARFLVLLGLAKSTTEARRFLKDGIVNVGPPDAKTKVGIDSVFQVPLD